LTTSKVEQPEVLTSFSRPVYHNYISQDINDFTLARDGQNSLAKSGQGQWLMQDITLP
jgi:hypothetical protein